MSNPKECRYCGKESFGSGCMYSPDGFHVAIGESSFCIYCGSSNYGSGCYYNNKDHVHKHGHGEGKCVWCGQKLRGAGCLYSPSGKHQM